MSQLSSRSSVSQLLVTLAACIVIIAGMRSAVELLVPFFLAAFIAIISAPPMFWLQQKGLPTWLALLVVIAIVVLICFLIAVLVGSSVSDFTENIPVYEQKLRQSFNALLAWVEKLGIKTSALALPDTFNPGAGEGPGDPRGGKRGPVETKSILIVMTVVFMLLDAAGLPAKLQIILNDPEQSLPHFDDFIRTVKHYMAIKTGISIVTSILITIALMIIGVSYAILWGVLAFFLNFVPNIGAIIAAVPAVMMALVQLGISHALMVAAVYLGVNFIIGSIIEPRFMGRGLGLSTLVVFMSLLFWGWVLGPVGMLLSVPLTITAKIALNSREETRWVAVLLGSDHESMQRASG